MSSASETCPRPRGLPAAKLGAGLAALLALGACIQGPWDFYPKNPPPFRGLSVTGYAIAGKPIRTLCFERVLDLDEEATDAFPFYDSADIRITGEFGGVLKTLALSPKPDTANCFVGDSADTVGRGKSYALEARIVWDSAGKRVASVITGTANVPASFVMHRRAAAPSLAKTGGIPGDLFSGDSIVTKVLAFFAILPPNVQQAMLSEYGQDLIAIQNDSAAVRAYALKNGAKIQARLVELLEADKFTYPADSSVYYLNGPLNLLSHYFSCDRSDDVKGVLVTHRFDPAGARPETRFGEIFGGGDTGDYYFPGHIRRLILYPEAVGPRGWNLLDSMAVVNTWFMAGLNRLYFYGTEQAYTQYHATNTRIAGGGGPEDGDPRIKPKFNVQGGTGIFAGMVPDSFDVTIKIDSLTKSYPLDRAHALDCREEGWLASKDCRAFYRPLCSSRGWQDSDCGVDAVAACLEADAAADTALKARCSPMADTVRAPERAAGVHRYCVTRNFPGGVCAAAKVECSAAGPNPCKTALWDYCKDNLWKDEQCQPALAAYCRDRNRPSETMCRVADAWCAANPGEAACK